MEQVEEDEMKQSGIRKLARTVSTGALVVAVASAVAPRVSAESVAHGETTMAVGRALHRLPYYGVFDFLAYGVERGTVTLAGYAYRGNLRTDASRAVKKVSGVDEVANQIEVLPASQEDDRTRATGSSQASGPVKCRSCSASPTSWRSGRSHRPLPSAHRFDTRDTQTFPADDTLKVAAEPGLRS